MPPPGLSAKGGRAPIWSCKARALCNSRGGGAQGGERPRRLTSRFPKGGGERTDQLGSFPNRVVADPSEGGGRWTRRPGTPREERDTGLSCVGACRAPDVSFGRCQPCRP